MENNKKMILIIIVIAIVFGIIFLKNSNKKESNTTTMENEIIQENVVMIHEESEKVVRRLLENAGFELKEKGIPKRSLNGDKGTEYEIFLRDNSEEYDEINKIEMYFIDIDLRRNVNIDFNPGEVFIDDEVYYIYENVLIKLTGNEKIDNKIKETLSK